MKHRVRRFPPLPFSTRDAFLTAVAEVFERYWDRIPRPDWESLIYSRIRRDDPAGILWNQFTFFLHTFEEREFFRTGPDGKREKCAERVRWHFIPYGGVFISGIRCGDDPYYRLQNFTLYQFWEFHDELERRHEVYFPN
ncbi:MAG: hypothetical protein GXO27_03735 [Chlorobi bacterium]|nr:hypothetical protein [Chlorobiota bacterium]